MSDLIKREDAIKAIHNYWKKRLDTLPTKESEYGEVYADIQQMDKILEHNKTLCNFIDAIPSADRPQGEWIRTGRTNIYGGIEVQCSNCGDRVMVQHLEDEWYCRHCGADMGMKGADDE